jgi:glycosyltransferase involved in cell wall biosynthesis
MKYELSIVIPARQEEFLARTIQDILENTSEKTEVIAVLDGAWSNPPIPQHPRVNVIYLPESIGQRAATNIGVRLSKAKYVAKVDAHCAFDKDFDTKMLEGFKKNGDNVTMVPIMKNLHVYDWKCYKCGYKVYQDKINICPKDQSTMRKKMVWQPRRGVNSVSYSFDSEPHFQYFEDYKHREPFLTDKKTGFTEVMSLQGSFFMATREKYWELELSGEDIGSWGNQGCEVACKTWLSGGRVIVNHNTWYAHCFRTKGEIFGFPYPQSGKHVSRTKQRVKDLIWSGEINGQIHPLVWLLDKFSPIPGWAPEEIERVRKLPFKVRIK